MDAEEIPLPMLPTATAEDQVQNGVGEEAKVNMDSTVTDGVVAPATSNGDAIENSKLIQLQRMTYEQLLVRIFQRLDIFI